MEETKHIQIKDFNYELPEERIAKFPLPERDQSKLLVYRHGTVGEDTFTSLPDYLPQGALMVFNNTKVIQPSPGLTRNPESYLHRHVRS